MRAGGPPAVGSALASSEDAASRNPARCDPARHRITLASLKILRADALMSSDDSFQRDAPAKIGQTAPAAQAGAWRVPQSAIAPHDGRQSDAARAIQRGARRLFAKMGAVTLDEVALANGRRADLIALFPNGVFEIVEIKSSPTDFRVDRKWPDYKDFCDRLSFAVNMDMPLELMPAEAGLIVADAFGAERLREGEAHPLSGARRKAMLVRFGVLAASRLHLVCDPDALGPR
jgi:hypothetical protein